MSAITSHNALRHTDVAIGSYLLGEIPSLHVSQKLLGSRGELEFKGEPVDAVDVLDKVEDSQDLGFDLNNAKETVSESNMR